MNFPTIDALFLSRTLNPSSHFDQDQPFPTMMKWGAFVRNSQRTRQP